MIRGIGCDVVEVARVKEVILCLIILARNGGSGWRWT